MRTKTLLFILCSLFLICACGQDSSLSILGGDKLLCEDSNQELVKKTTDTPNSPKPKSICYYVTFDKNTGSFTLFYLRSDIYSLLFNEDKEGESVGGSGNMGGDGNEGDLIEPIPPVNQICPVPSKITLNYKVDIYITKDNKILYPPVYLPNCRLLPEYCTELEKDLLFERNQYSNVFYSENNYTFMSILKPEYEKADKIIYKDSDITGLIEPIFVKNTVVYKVKDNNMYFHIYPDSYIFEEGVNEVDLGRIYIGNYDTVVGQIVDNVLYDINYSIYIDLKLIKGDPPIINPDDYIKFPVDKLYNIQVNESEETICVYDLTDKKNIVLNAPEWGLKAYKDSGFYRNQDNTISIIDSKGKQIVKYPNTYNLKMIPNLNPLPLQ